jgi:hypothetical protein
VGKRLMRIVTVERDVWYEEGKDWKAFLRKGERLISASVEYDPNHPAFDAPLFGEKEWCLHCGSDTCEHATQHNAAYGRTA